MSLEGLLSEADFAEFEDALDPFGLGEDEDAYDALSRSMAEVANALDPFGVGEDEDAYDALSTAEVADSLDPFGVGEDEAGCGPLSAAEDDMLNARSSTGHSGGTPPQPNRLALEKTKAFLGRNRKHAEKHANKEKELQRIVLQAAEGGHADVVRQALPVLTELQQRLSRSNTPDLNFDQGKGVEDKKFYTPLMFACEGGHKGIVRLLVKHGAKVGHIAGHYQTKGVYKKRIGSRVSAMHVASIQGRADIVQLLITRAEDGLLKGSLSDILNAKTKDRWTPLMYAVKEGHIEVVQLLLKQKSLEGLAVNRKGQTALHIAGLHSRPSCLQAMHTALAEREDSREELAKEEENPYLQTDKTGYNVLHRICKGCRGSEEGNASVKTLKWLFETMPHLDLQKFHNLGTKEKGYTMLLLACDNGNEGLVEYLLSEKAVDVSCTAEDGKTGLHLAAMHDYSKIAELLISHGISLTAQDKEYKLKGSDELVGEDTALHISMKKSSTHVEEMIRSKGKENGESLDIKNKSGETPDEVKQEDIIPLEIRRLGEEAVQRYRQLLRRGKKKKMPRCNLIALGEERVGKTSLLCLLMGKEFVKGRKPTQGIDNDCVDVTATSVNVLSETWQKVEVGEFIRKNDEQFADSVAEQIPELRTKPKSQIPPNKEVLKKAVTEIDKYLKKVEEKAQKQTEPLVPAGATPSTSTQEPPPEPASSNPSVTTASKSEARPVDPATMQRESPPVPKPMEPNTTQSTPKTVAPVVQPPSSQVSEARPRRGRGETQKHTRVSRQTSKNIVFRAKQGPSEEEPEQLRYNTLDFAGQPEYRAMHHCFIVRRAIYLVVFNLQKVREALRAPTEENKRVLEEIQYWLNSIHAHIHNVKAESDAGDESCLKRILLVGTHRCPKGEDAITDDDMIEIDEKLRQRYIEGTPILNDMYRADPSGKVWFAAVENSIDGTDEGDREKSGAYSLQKSIHEAWNELPFKDEEYPTTWLRFEAYLIQKRDKPIVDAEEIRKIAKDTHGIGEEKEEDIELALGFFHDTGTIVYPRKLPTLYLSEEQKKVLDELILLDPAWLTKMMRIVMELKAGKGSKLTNQEKDKFEKTGCAKLSLLRKCWSGLSNEYFDKLMLMLQAFCLVFPLPAGDSHAATGQSSATPPACQADHGENDRQACHTQDNILYLIPSKLATVNTQPTDDSDFNFTFVFDFGGFLPVEVYHRLLCLMLKNHNCASTTYETFTANYFEINGGEDCSWFVRMVDSKLYMSVYYSPESQKHPPSCYVLKIHMEYLEKIFNEKGSSLQGLKYIGGPEHQCKRKKLCIVVPYVSYPEEKEAEAEWKCPSCRTTHNIDLLLDPEFKPSLKGSSCAPSVEAISEAVPRRDITAESVIFADHSTVHIHMPPQSAGPGLKSPMAPLKLSTGPNLPTKPPVPPAAIAATSHCDSRILGTADLYDVLEAIVDVKDKWFMLGLALGLKMPTLREIRKDYNGIIVDCKCEMLTKWLEKADGCTPSWASLVTALKTKNVDHKSIADKIEQDHLIL